MYRNLKKSQLILKILKNTFQLILNQINLKKIFLVNILLLLNLKYLLVKIHFSLFIFIINMIDSIFIFLDFMKCQIPLTYYELIIISRLYKFENILH